MQVCAGCGYEAKIASRFCVSCGTPRGGTATDSATAIRRPVDATRVATDVQLSGGPRRTLSLPIVAAVAVAAVVGGVLSAVVVSGQESQAAPAIQTAPPIQTAAPRVETGAPSHQSALAPTDDTRSLQVCDREPYPFDYAITTQNSSQTLARAADSGDVEAIKRATAITSLQAAWRMNGQHRPSTGVPFEPIGDFAAQGKQVIEQLQRANGLPVTGQIEADTWDQLQATYC